MIASKFIQEFQSELSKIEELKIEHPEALNDLPDMVIKDNNGNEIFIEMQDAKSYGELPLATAFQLKKIKDKYPQVLLISFSNISDILATTLNNLGVKYLVKPKVGEATEKVLEIAGMDKFAYSS